MRHDAIRGRFWTTTILGSLMALLILALTAQPAAAQVKKNRNAEVTSYNKQLTARFKSWDLNGDKVLDSTELALAFRGPNAKPYDAGQDITPAALKTNVDKNKLKLLARLTPYTASAGTPINYVLADMLFRTWYITKPADPAVYNSYPDYQFVLLAGTTGLPKLTKQEYDSWATTYANMIADVQDATRNLAAAQSKAQKAKKGTPKTTAMTELAQRQQDLVAANNVLQTIPPAIQQKLAVKR